MIKHFFWGLIVLVSIVFLGFQFQNRRQDIYSFSHVHWDEGLKFLLIASNKQTGVSNILLLSPKEKAEFLWDPSKKEKYQVLWKSIKPEEQDLENNK